jgi:7-carboxy-7-deazaguanine synthase
MNNTPGLELLTIFSSIPHFALSCTIPTFGVLEYKLHSLRPEEEELLKTGQILPVMEEFYTLQGEGFNTGQAAHFIRLGGCDVGCHWCDVKESWNANLHPLTNINHLIEKVKESKAPSVVITGGEPLLYNLDLLCNALKQTGIKTFIETSGAYALSGQWDWICLSPKKNLQPLPAIYKRANELKVIVYNHNDFVWAEKQAEKVGPECYLYLQAEWSKRNELMPEIIEYIKQHPRWMISLQSHKYMNIP